MLTVKQLKEALMNAPDDMEVLIGAECFREVGTAKIDKGFKTWQGDGGWNSDDVKDYFVIDERID